LKNKKLPYLTELVKKIAPRVGARVIIEPEWGVTAQLIYKNGVVRSVRLYSIDINRKASSFIARDKYFSKFFIKKHGYSVAEGKVVFRKDWAEEFGNREDAFRLAKKYAKKIGYPLIIKPNSRSMGAGVFLISNERELSQKLNFLFKDSRVVLVERYQPGKDYRVVVFDNKVFSAYERIPLSVVGDGKSTISKLLQNKKKSLLKMNRDVKIDLADDRIKNRLSRQGLKLSNILAKGRGVCLLDNANLSTGGDVVDVTDIIHSGFKKIAIKLTHDMGLRIAGVDLMVTSGDISKAPTKKNHYIIEINSSPGIDHFVTTGEKQKKIIEDMYLKIFKELGKKDYRGYIN
jgi:D-alanine-D-alanine ligase-like ATP-grasp enzyme